jgi:hypothetical protein
MKNLLAELQIAPNRGFTGFGPLGLQGTTASNADITFTNFLSSTIGVLTIIAIIWFVFILITGAISYMSSGGDKAAIESSGKKILNGVIGLVVVVIAIFIIKLIGYLIGIPDILNFTFLFGNVAGLVVNH